MNRIPSRISVFYVNCVFVYNFVRKRKFENKLYQTNGLCKNTSKGNTFTCQKFLPPCTWLPGIKLAKTENN